MVTVPLPSSVAELTAAADVPLRQCTSHSISEYHAKLGYTLTMVPLQEIFFYQDYVCPLFMDGRGLAATIEALQEGDVTPESLPPIECLNYRGKWYGMGNRRLACFHFVFGASEPTRLIPVLGKVIDDGQELLPQGSGTVVSVGRGLTLGGSPVFHMFHCLHRR